MKPTKIQGWEYERISESEYSLDDLNKLGKKGWELVSVVCQTITGLGLDVNEVYLYLKRPLTLPKTKKK